jgi:hypothetical protein
LVVLVTTRDGNRIGVERVALGWTIIYPLTLRGRG